MYTLKSVFRNHFAYHLLVLMLLFVPPLVYTQYIAKKSMSLFFINLFVINGALLLVIYINLFLLIPRFLKKRKLLTYALLLALLIAFDVVVSYQMQKTVQQVLKYPDEPIIYFIMSTTVNIVQYLLISFFLFNMREKFEQEKRMDQIKVEQLRTEINYLRAQINPHFLFNTLNNLYGLALEQSDKTPGIIMKLSKMMDYMLYESEDAMVYLKNDLENIENYIALEQIRQGNKASIRLAINGVIGEQKIVPLLLLPLIENGVKHGINQQIHDAFLNIAITVQHGEITMIVKNNYNENARSDARKGTGLANLKRRLDLFYPGRHDLAAAQNGNEFEASLKINL